MLSGSDNTHWLKEGLLTTFTASLYGVANTLSGHPLDTIKTKMQAQEGYADKGHHYGLKRCIKEIYLHDGLIGYYRGCVPPLFGSVIFRSL
jgi:solute carrier family 25 carnitine/acylcarnitine transporter 20/29